MVTCGTYKKLHLLNTPSRLSFVQEALFDIAEEYKWRLQAWAVLSNHYHFVASSPENPETLSKVISKLHTLTAIKLNKEDSQPGRRVWYQYFDSHITYQNSYFVWLKYVHTNPAHHQVVSNAGNYPWCSAAWFARSSESAFYKTIQSFKTDTVNVIDFYDLIPIQQKSESSVKPPHSKPAERSAL